MIWATAQPTCQPVKLCQVKYDRMKLVSNDKIVDRISVQTKISPGTVANTVQLITSESTISFICRYRREVIGGINVDQVKQIQQLWIKFQGSSFHGMALIFLEIESRKQAILRQLTKKGKLTESLQHQIQSIFDLKELEDIYAPFKKVPTFHSSC